MEAAQSIRKPRQFSNTGIYIHLWNLHGRESNSYPLEFESSFLLLRHLQVHRLYDLSIIIMNSTFGRISLT